MNHRITTLVLISLLSINIISCKNSSTNKIVASNEDNTRNNVEQQQRGGGMLDKSSNMELKTLLEETIDKFVQLEYIDSETGKSMLYNLFIPEEYDKNKQYPLVLFMPDASTVGKDIKTPLTQGFGGIIWASDRDQAKHPSFVLVPQYTTQTVNDQFETTDEVEMTIRLLNSIVNKYSVNKEQLYTTGQSMGGMMSMYFNIAYPNLFAASIFVGCQWDTSKMDGFAKDKFCYIVAAGDEKAPKGMAALEKVLKSKGANIGMAEWSAKLSEQEQDANVEKLLSEGHNINFITFMAKSVLPTDSKGNEHMYSFDYAYKLEGIRDWLFKQKK